MSRYRPVYVKNLIDRANETFVQAQTKSEWDILFGFFRTWLIEKGYYEGFNYFKFQEVDGVKHLVLAGSPDPEQYDCIQLL